MPILLTSIVALVAALAVGPRLARAIGASEHPEAAFWARDAVCVTLASVLACLALEAWNDGGLQVTLVYARQEFYVVLAVMSAAYLLSLRRGTLMVVASVASGIVGLAQHYTWKFRGTPVIPSDVTGGSLGTAREVAGGYDLTPDETVLLTIGFALLAVAVSCLVRRPRPEGEWTAALVRSFASLDSALRWAPKDARSLVADAGGDDATPAPADSGVDGPAGDPDGLGDSPGIPGGDPADGSAGGLRAPGDSQGQGGPQGQDGPRDGTGDETDDEGIPGAEGDDDGVPAEAALLSVPADDALIEIRPDGATDAIAVIGTEGGSEAEDDGACAVGGIVRDGAIGAGERDGDALDGEPDDSGKGPEGDGDPDEASEGDRTDARRPSVAALVPKPVRSVASSVAARVTALASPALTLLVIWATVTGALSLAAVDYKEQFPDMVVDWWQITQSYRRQGTIPTFSLLMQEAEVSEPDGWSEQAAQADMDSLVASYEPAEPTMRAYGGTLPDIVGIMNESYCDMTVYDRLELPVEAAPQFMRTDAPEGIVESGRMRIPVFGGKTANSEYEFLTGDSLIGLGMSTIPFAQYNLSSAPSLPRQLRGLGYATVAMHPCDPRNWDRNSRYTELGFEEFLSERDFIGAGHDEQFHGVISDRACYAYASDVLEENGAAGIPTFIWNVTMQNHGSYDKGDVPAGLENESDLSALSPETGGQVREFMGCADESSRATLDFLAELEERERPTVVVFFGDHQPVCNGAIVSELYGDIDASSVAALEYQTCYFIWQNRAMREATGQEVPSDGGSPAATQGEGTARGGSPTEEAQPRGTAAPEARVLLPGTAAAGDGDDGDPASGQGDRIGPSAPGGYEADVTEGDAQDGQGDGEAAVALRPRDEIGTNMLAAHLLELLGYPLTDFQKAVLSLRSEARSMCMIGIVRASDYRWVLNGDAGMPEPLRRVRDMDWLVVDRKLVEGERA